MLRWRPRKTQYCPTKTSIWPCPNWMFLNEVVSESDVSFLFTASSLAIVALGKEAVAVEKKYQIWTWPGESQSTSVRLFSPKPNSSPPRAEQLINNCSPRQPNTYRYFTNLLLLFQHGFFSAAVCQLIPTSF